MTATEWDKSSMDPTNWWMTEKFDGMRLFWNGSHFFTRQGRKVSVPDFLRNSMPNYSLDGELW
jgi:DNA ligase-1